MRATHQEHLGRLTPRRAFALALAAYFLLAAAWALALPVNGTYDEKHHIVWAYAVLDGQLESSQRTVDASGNPTDGFRAPRSLLPANADCTWHPKSERPKPASCLDESVDRGEIIQPSAAARYNPVYYVLVGLPLRVAPDEAGIVGARLLSAAFCAVLLAAATAVAVRLRNRLLLAALVLVSTPLAMNLSGSVNPNGLEISAGVLLFVALLAMLRGEASTAVDLGEGVPGAGSADDEGSSLIGSSSPRPLLLLAGVAAFFLLTVRSLGPLLAALVVLACVAAARPGRVRALVRDRDARRWLGIPAAAGVLLAAGWALVSRHSAVQPLEANASDGSPAWILREIVLPRGEFYVRQVVAQFGYGETTVSLGMIGLWYLLVAALVVPAFWLGGRRLGLAIAGTFAACAALLVGLELYFVPIVGPFAHARYVMPLGVGVVLLSAFADRYAQWLDGVGWLHRVVVGLVAVTVPLDLYALARVMTRFQRGIDAGLSPLGGVWQPAAGPVLPLLSGLVGAALLAVIVTRSSVRRTPEHSTVNTLSN